MSDIVRAKAAILALLADNSAGDISPQDLRDMLVSLWVFGSISARAGSTAQAAVTTTQVQLINFTNDDIGASNGTTPDFANNKITVLEAGIFLIEFFCTLTGTAATKYTFQAAVDGVAKYPKASIEPATGATVSSISFAGIISLSASDVVTVLVNTDEAGGDSLTIEEAQLIVRRVG